MTPTLTDETWSGNARKRKKGSIFLYVYRSEHPSCQAAGRSTTVYRDNPPHSSAVRIDLCGSLHLGLLGSRGMILIENITPLSTHTLQQVQDEINSEVHNRPKKVMLTNASPWMYLAMESINFTHVPVSTNETPVQPSQGPTESRMALPIFMFAGGAIGNIIAIIVLSVSRQERKSSAFFTLVCGLAVTDLLGTCLASPLTIANYLNPNVLTDRHLCEFDSFLLLFFGLTGLSIICAMAAERYLAICCPYTYQRWRVDRRFAQKFLLCIYISHIFFCCLPMMGMAGSKLQPSKTWCFINWRADEPVAATYTVLYGVVSVLLILGTIVLNLAVCGSLLLMRQRTVQLPVARSSVRERWRALSSAAETQMMTVLVMTSAVVLACSAPLVVRVFANRFLLTVDSKADLAAIRIASVNPILDPWIYILLRKSLFRRLLSLSRRGSSSRSSSTSTTRNPFYTEITKDSHVFSELMRNTNIITQLPATVKFTSHDTVSLQQT